MRRTLACLVLVATAWTAPGDAGAGRTRVRPGSLGRAALRARTLGRPLPRRAIARRPVARRPPSGPGRLEPRTAFGRELFLYLPPGFRPGDRRRYRVLILQDGQNLFGEGTGSWQVHRAIDAEVQAGRIEPVIVVGIPAQPSHQRRVAEYAVHRDDAEQLGGAGAAYIDFLADRLVPWLRRELPVRSGPDAIAIGGSSMGARIALEAALARPDTFGKVIAMSPSVWFNGREILRRVEDGDRLPETFELYLDSGGSGDSRDDADNVARLRDAFLARSFEHGSWDAPARRAPRRLWHWFEPRHRHDEAAWRERFPRALRVMFPAGQAFRATSAATTADSISATEMGRVEMRGPRDMDPR
ncbi:MAG TPA: alpha/beta hydrolase-fold protein [Kofleriaceae bacterium]|nr:alpha/beta hydrolase-fold protein [Kofleriaceae bacterium]